LKERWVLASKERWVCPDQGKGPKNERCKGTTGVSYTKRHTGKGKSLLGEKRLANFLKAPRKIGNEKKRSGHEERRFSWGNLPRNIFCVRGGKKNATLSLSEKVRRVSFRIQERTAPSGVRKIKVDQPVGGNFLPGETPAGKESFLRKE